MLCYKNNTPIGYFVNCLVISFSMSFSLEVSQEGFDLPA